MFGNVTPVTKYADDIGGHMPANAGVKRYLVSASGQMSLPAEARHRWRLDNGGPVEVVDLGFGVLTVPVGQGEQIFRDLLSRDDQASFVASLDDPDLKTT
jgi:bifunctional DNA-binding transcriptional regulator/antitoxin component of YhaV-PrlF toxin-antitoxin module